jgi:DNA invertase Pin-like site-specific DNA recombinase
MSYGQAPTLTALIGYARISTTDQSFNLQRAALAKADCNRVFKDKASGAKAERPGLLRAMKALQSGDTLVVWKLDGLGRTLHHLIELVEELRQRGVMFRSLTEGFETWTRDAVPYHRCAG